MDTRITQREMVLTLLREKREINDKFIPVWWFVGERLSSSLGKHILLSHRAPARLTELFQEGIAEREMVKGKSGAHYYSYRLKIN